jgi:hypothetical protein
MFVWEGEKFSSLLKKGNQMQATDAKKKKPKQNLKYLQEKNREKVKGIFKFYEVPGGSMGFVFKEFKGDPVEKYEMVDGQVYTIPLGVAKHLNKNGSYPVHAYTMQDDGKPVMQIGKKVRRFGFQSLEFVDIGDFAATGGGEIEEVVVLNK